MITSNVFVGIAAANLKGSLRQSREDEVAVQAAGRFPASSKDGPAVPPLADIPARLGQQLDAVKPQWLDPPGVIG
jgi:hypothetical protein